MVEKVKTEMDERVLKAGKDAIVEVNLRGVHLKVVEVRTMPSMSPTRSAAGPRNTLAEKELSPLANPAGHPRLLLNGTEGMPFKHAATVVLGELQLALAGLLAAGPTETPIRKVADVEHGFGVNYMLAWQVYRIVHAENPLAIGGHVPSRTTMKKLLTAAARRRVPGEIIDRVSEAFERFEALVESDAGDREELEAMLSAFLPEERRKQELASRQIAFKGMSQIKGLATEAVVTTHLFSPAVDGTVDVAILNCSFGLRRIRPDARIVDWTMSPSDPTLNAYTLSGAPVDGPLGSLLPQFSTSPLPQIETREMEGMAYYRVVGDEIGMRSAVDLVMGDRRNGVKLARGAAHALDIPAKRATLDVFVHKDLHPDPVPSLAVYDTAVRGVVRRFNDPAREDDRLFTYDEIATLPVGLAGARLPHVPRYVEMLEYAYNQLGWNPADFLGYRLDVQYPVYGGQYMIRVRSPKQAET